MNPRIDLPRAAVIGNRTMYHAKGPVKDGFEAAEAGRPKSSCPFPKFSVKYFDWMKGWWANLQGVTPWEQGAERRKNPLRG